MNMQWLTSDVSAFHTDNNGVSGARQYGLNTAKYIQFIDSDDWIEQDCFENFFNS